MKINWLTRQAEDVYVSISERWVCKFRVIIMISSDLVVVAEIYSGLNDISDVNGWPNNSILLNHILKFQINTRWCHNLVER